MANKRKTHEEFVAKVRLYTDEDIEFLNKYETKRSEMKIKCNTCGHKWSIRQANIFSAFKRNKDYILCPECRKQLEFKNLQEKFKNKFYELLGDEYELLSEYKDDKEKITVKHNVCGRIYDVRASSMFGKEQTRCKRCSDKKRAEKLSWSPELFEEKFYDKFSPEEFKIITKYSTKRENIVIKHLQCGHEWEAKPPRLIKNERG